MNFYESPRFYIPTRYFDESIFTVKQPFYLTKSTDAKGEFATLKANRGDALLFITDEGTPRFISLKEAREEQVYIGKIVMEESA